MTCFPRRFNSIIVFGHTSLRTTETVQTNYLQAATLRSLDNQWSKVRATRKPKHKRNFVAIPSPLSWSRQPQILSPERCLSKDAHLFRPSSPPVSGFVIVFGEQISNAIRCSCVLPKSLLFSYRIPQDLFLLFLPMLEAFPSFPSIPHLPLPDSSIACN